MMMTRNSLTHTLTQTLTHALSHALCTALLTLGATLSLTSCEKTLDFEYHNINPIPVIEGNLTTTRTEVTITHTTDVDKPIDRTHITDAIVVISDLTDGSERVLSPDADGIFSDRIGGIPGHDYKLKVRIGDSRFESDCSMLYPVQILSFGFNWVQVPIGQMAIAQVAFTDNPLTKGDCYIVRLFRNDEIYSVHTISDIQAVNNILVQLIMTTTRDNNMKPTEDDSLLVDGDEIRVSVTPVSRAYYDYLVALSQGSNGNRMFEGDFCLGYFLAAPETDATVIFHPDQIPEFEY